MEKEGYIYILTNNNNTVLYTGVTSNLPKRIYEHKNHLVDGFSKKYNLEKLVYYEMFQDISTAIQREKQIKAGSRKSKEKLINSINKSWSDLANDLF